jgi:small subunit ribosomal protein S4
MGDPRKPRKKWSGPGHPWKRERLEQEIRILGKYGLRNKKELWIAQTMARKIRHRARFLLGQPEEIRAREETILLKKLKEMGFIGEGAVLDDVLSLTSENILSRRLQTIVYTKGLARTIFEARQMIVHGHIGIGGRRVTSPGYLVSRSEERLVDILPSSPLRKRLEATQ